MTRRRCARCQAFLRPTNPEAICSPCDLAERNEHRKALQRAETPPVASPPPVVEEWDRMRELLDAGMTVPQIMRAMDMPYGIAKGWAASIRAGRLCRVCGRPLQTHNPIEWKCAAHREAKGSPVFWTQELIIDAMLTFHAENGRWPRWKDWNDNPDPRYPRHERLRERFGSSRIALLAAQAELERRQKRAA